MPRSHWVVISTLLTILLAGCGGGGGGNGDSENRAPVADAGPNQYVPTGSFITLDGSGSHDTDGDSLSYSWSFDVVPLGSAAVLSDETAASPTFTADLSGDYVASLMVNDGTSTSTTSDTVTVTAITSGWLIPDFGTGGVVTSNPSVRSDTPSDVVSDGTHLYIVGGDEIPGTMPQWRIEKRSIATGELDPSFGVGGVVTRNFDPGIDYIYAAVIEGDHLYAVGVDQIPILQWRIEKYSLATGYLDPTFGSGGAVTSDPSSSHDYAYDVVSDGTFLYIVGTDWSPDNVQWRIEKRSLSTGLKDTNFGSYGVVTSNPSTGWDLPNEVVHDGTHLYVVGYDASPAGGSGDYKSQYRIEKRSMATGELDSAFGTEGVVTKNLTDFHDVLTGVASDGTYLYVTGSTNATSLGGVIEKRNLSDGALVAGFGTGGVVNTSDQYPGLDAVSGVVVDGFSLYVYGKGQYTYDYFDWHVEKRDADTGLLITSFGFGGKIRSDPSDENDWMSQVITEGNLLFLLGSDESNGADDRQWRLEKRLK